MSPNQPPYTFDTYTISPVEGEPGNLELPYTGEAVFAPRIGKCFQVLQMSGVSDTIYGTITSPLTLIEELERDKQWLITTENGSVYRVTKEE